MRPLLRDALPDLADEVTALLNQDGATELAGQVKSLRLVERCRCGDDFCATIYTAPKPKGAWGPTHESLPLLPASGYVILDLVEKQIVCIEVLFRNDLRRKVLRLFP